MNVFSFLILCLLACGIVAAVRQVRRGGTCSCHDCPGHCAGCCRK